MANKLKGLEFSSDEPAFLRRIRGEISGRVDDPDRHVTAIARPQRPKRLDQDEDDGPTYVMEDSTTLSKEEYEAMVKGDMKGEENATSGQVEDTLASTEEAFKARQTVSGTGILKKRKAAKIIGADEDDNDATNAPPAEASEKKTTGDFPGKSKAADKKAPPKKKKAKVNITYGDDDEV